MKQKSIVFLPCTNIQVTYHFYHEILGLNIYMKQNENVYIFDTGYGYWGFCEYEDQRNPLSGPTGVCLSIDYDTKDEVLEKFKEIKAVYPIYKEPTHHANFPVYSFFIQDPDGYLVEFQSIDK